MARPALPKNVHILKGTAKKDPARMRARENEPENTNPLGKPPEELNTEEKKYFNRLAKEAITGVLGEADRTAVAIAAKLMANFYGEEEFTAAMCAQLTRLLGQFGMTPSERSKINLPSQKKKNSFAD